MLRVASGKVPLIILKTGATRNQTEKQTPDRSEYRVCTGLKEKWDPKKMENNLVRSFKNESDFFEQFMYRGCISNTKAKLNNLPQTNLLFNLDRSLQTRGTWMNQAKWWEMIGWTRVEQVWRTQ